MSKTPLPANIIEACKSEAWFRPMLVGELATWQTWLVFLKTLFAIPFDSEEELNIYRKHTGRKYRPDKPFTEAWLVIGRKGGKSFMMALIAVWLACFKTYKKRAPGEKGMVMVVAQDRRTARHILGFVKGILAAIPILKRDIKEERADAVEMKTGIIIEVRTANFKAVRGPTVVACINDEIAFWQSDDGSASPDVEIIAAQKPSMATTPGAIMLCASSPFAKQGAMWEAYEKHFGRDNDPVLVWQATTRDMNPLIPQEWIDSELEKDYAKNSAEYLAVFRDDVEAFLNADAIQACIDPGVRERRYVTGQQYYGFVDTAGGSGQDSFVVAISHRSHETGFPVLDVVREFKPPFSPGNVIEEVSQLFKSYKIRMIKGDKYASEFPVEEFAKHGITFEQTAATKSMLYIDFLALVNSVSCLLLDNARMVEQLLGLRRWTSRNGKDMIDHQERKHDDVANAIAGAIVEAGLGKQSRYTYNLMRKETLA